MTLHIFNPEHDIALASGLANFTAPHAGRQLRHDLGWLPALWASEDDIILVDDIEKAKRCIRNRKVSTRHFIAKDTAPALIKRIDCIDPWGWNAALRAQLLRMGISEALLPSSTDLDNIRRLSHRQTAAQLLKSLQTEDTVGESFQCTSKEDVTELLKRYGQLVLKAPWSSSGRGIRFINSQESLLSTSVDGWLRNTISMQGSVMVEPYYNKVKDFGMEFYSDGTGGVSYEGLSLFHTTNGAYTGNIIATEQAKKAMITRYIPGELPESIQSEVCVQLGKVFDGKYCGPFGLDMMIVAGGDQQRRCKLHPCVEINLRRTMGHVALSLCRILNPTNDDDLLRTMRIEYTNNNYRFRIKRL